MMWMRKIVLGLCLVLVFIMLGDINVYAAEDVVGFKEAVTEGILAQEEKVDISAYEIDRNNIYDYFYDVYYENPYLFIAEWKAYTPVGDKVISLRFSYRYTKAQVDNFYKKFDIEVEKIVSAVKGMSNFEKILYVHEYFVSNISYDYDSYLKYAAGKKDALADEHYTAIGVLVNKTGVCQGYALAFNYIMDKLGIECHMLTSDTMNHAWNVVKLDGNYYHIDTTWDDPVYDTVGKVEHEYFLVSDAKLKSLGYSGYDTTQYPATSKKYDNYFWKNVSSAFTYYGGYWYYVNNSGVICKYNAKTNSSANVLALPDKRWNVISNPKYYYSGYFATFRVQNGKLYFNTKDKIYRLDVNAKKAYVAVSPKISNGYIYGLGMINDKIVYQVKPKPSEKGALYSCSDVQILSINNYFSANVICEQRDVSKCTASVATAYYSGKAQKPKVVVKYEDYTLVAGTDYSLTYSNNVALGTGQVTITGKGNYTGKLSKKFSIKLGTVSGVKTAARTKQAVKISWTSVPGATYYQVLQYNAKTKKYVYVGKTTKTNFTKTKLTKNTTYYYKIRACRGNQIGSYSTTYKTYTSK